MPRLFLSYSSKDKVETLAFKNWLLANGWRKEDVFIDMHNISAGETWRDSLRRANASCEAVVLMASPHSLGSIECQKELELAEALGKEIIIAIVRDMTKSDPLLARYASRQFADLTADPKECIEPFEFKGETQRIQFSSEALASIKTRLENLGIAPDSFLWPPKGAKNPEPYPGLAAFGEDEAGIFFGREADILSALTEIRQSRRRRLQRLIVINAASGAGKSSFLRAGLWPRLKRDDDFAPLGILRPAQGILSGTDGLGRALANNFQDRLKPKAAGTITAAIAQTDTAKGCEALKSLLSEATQLAWSARQVNMPEAPAPAIVLAIDQGEEMFSAGSEVESRKLMALLATVLKAPPPDVDLYLLVTIRSESAQGLLDWVAELEMETPRAIYLPPLSATAYQDVITKPAEVFSKRVRSVKIEPALTSKLITDSTGADALPLLSFTLSRLFADYGTLGLITSSHYEEMGGINGSISRALDEARMKAGASGTLDHLHRLMVPRLATWDPDANQKKGAAKRVVASVADAIGGDRVDLKVLAEALEAARLLTRGSDSLEVAHEALLRQPPISDWIEEARDFLVWRDRLSRERQSFEANLRGLLSGRELQIARNWLNAREPLDIVPSDRQFVLNSIAADTRRRNQEEEDARQSRRLQRQIWQMAALVGVLFLGIGTGILWSNRAYLVARGTVLKETIWPRVLTADDERTLVPLRKFQECSGCPEMVVVPEGEFSMGSTDPPLGYVGEQPVHRVTIAKKFAVGRVAITFDEWDVCVTLGGCPWVPDQGWGRGNRPVINVNRSAADQYVKWLADRTQKPYRLLSESEFEYAARAGTTTRYWWSDDKGTGQADCDGCGGEWESKRQTAPVGSFGANAFGLYDMHGNTWTWVQDCYHADYVGAPPDGSAWMTGDCTFQVTRGGGWYSPPNTIRAANRGKSNLRRLDAQGLRVARTLSQ